MMLRLLSLVLILAVGAVRAQVPPEPMDPLAAALQVQVEALNSGNLETLGAPVAWPQLIHHFYTHRSFKPAWAEPQAAGQLRRALEDSRLDGLDPGDYHLPLLVQLADQIASGNASLTVRANYDLLQTDALLRLGYHLSFGKVDPTTFDAQWNYVRTLENVDVEQEIEAALASNNVYQRVEALRPTHRLYVTLKRELATYRSVEAQGGWSSIPAGASIKPGAEDPRVPFLRANLIARGDLAATGQSESTVYDTPVQEAVRRFQARMGLKDDAVVGARTIEDLNVSVTERIRQIRVNLDRGRVVLHDLPREFVVVNSAGYELYLVRGADIVWQTRVQVGRTYRRTPIFRSEITYLVWNPTWTVPPGITRNDILPDAKRDPRSITRRGLDVLDASGKKLDPTTIDWSRYSSGIPYTLRQEPGPKNALGRVKFMFPNPYAVYLHDTPSRSLFESADRDFSSGCVRVEKPIELALSLLKDQDKWNEASVAKTIESNRTLTVTLPEKMPVLLTYWTAWVDQQDRVNFRRDVYGQDALWAAGLDEDFSVRKQPLFR
jgi:murein L,D-transpeptidase YcbB/YkuD